MSPQFYWFFGSIIRLGGNRRPEPSENDSNTVGTAWIPRGAHSMFLNSMSLKRLFENGRLGLRLHTCLPIGAILFVGAMIVSEPALAQGLSTSHTSSKSYEYRILKQPDSKQTAESVPQPAKSLIVAKPVQPYSYGWFGAKSSMHWHRQFGNRRVHTQWTLK